MIYRIINAFKFGYWAYKNPQVLNGSNMKMLADLLGLILKVAKEEKPYMTHIGFIHPEDGSKHEIVSIWAGSGIGAEPTKRIKELLEENSKLRAELSRNVLITPNQ